MLRRTFTFGTAALCGALLAGTAMAQDMRAPEGPIEFTVGSGAGGSPDVIMRTYAQIMAEQGIVPNAIVVQNRSGGGHSNAYNHVLGLPGDETTLLTLASPVFTTPIVQGTPSVIDQITPIALLAESELVLLTTPDSPLNSLQDVVAAATEAPGRVRVAGGSSGGNDHILTGLLETASGTTLTYIPHESGSAGRATFLGGNVELHFATLSEALELITSGTGKPLAIFSEERRPEEAFANVATAREQGVDVVYTQFWGVGGPAGLDPAVAAWWADKFAKAAESPQFQEWLDANLYRANMLTLGDAGTYFADGQQTFRDVLTRIGLAK
ncbi:Bug family tripartite tricarboxylate transporter substrate binding protein [Thetidibacter halocola]|uniref:Tripartite tricarboxylate transporter substrate binding protein n=1 Tax=Thetidibacter halocola TaxID=2827239 RepID=A0A8J7W9U5_9RHOB|nr:tripartite tricarboxylate transporter substrate binding protein [Thetidibacter halocola]MBS0122594.1 tripartite tricarboxylate transporter substrate binding protein [Thetidibacter halocola]